MYDFQHGNHSLRNEIRAPGDSKCSREFVGLPYNNQEKLLPIFYTDAFRNKIGEPCIEYENSLRANRQRCPYPDIYIFFCY